MPLKYRINNEIKTKTVRLISSNGVNLGIISTFEAMNIAVSSHLDLVEVAPHLEPPICKLLDYKKFMFEKTVQELEEQSTEIPELKEIRLRPKVDEENLQFKIKEAYAWLANGTRVKIRVWFRGNESKYPELGEDILLYVTEQLNDVSYVEQNSHIDGRTLAIILTPKNKI